MKIGWTLGLWSNWKPVLLTYKGPYSGPYFTYKRYGPFVTVRTHYKDIGETHRKMQKGAVRTMRADRCMKGDIMQREIPLFLSHAEHASDYQIFYRAGEDFAVVKKTKTKGGYGWLPVVSGFATYYDAQQWMGAAMARGELDGA